MPSNCLLIVGVLCSMLCSCIGTDAYYESQSAYYNAQASAITSQRPLARMTAPDGTVFEVANPNQIQGISQAKNPIVETFRTILTSTPISIIAGGWSAREMIQASTGSVSQIDNSSSSVDNSAVAEPVIVTQPLPTVIEQPPPVIVPPSETIIVKPEIITIPGVSNVD